MARLSKKFVAMILGLLLPTLLKKLFPTIPEESLKTMSEVIITYILGQAGVDIALAIKGLKH